MILSLVLSATSAMATNYVTPTKALGVNQYPHFSDDYQLRDMEVAIDRQLERYKQYDFKGTIRFGKKTYPLKRMQDSLMAFRGLIASYHSCREGDLQPKACDEALNHQVQQIFSVYVPDLKKGDPRYGESKSSFFTTYATQTIYAQSTRQGDFTHAIYRAPSGAAKSRDEIDFHGGLDGQGLELAYGANLYDLYLLHIEGSGYAQFPDGKGFYLSYAGTNNMKWTWISKYMMQKGYIKTPTTSAQRKFLREHPQLQEEIYSVCPSYVFFKPSDTPPAGSDEVSLTDGRSIATDKKLYAFKGGLTYVEAERPVETGNYDFELEDPSTIPMQSFSRFFLDQDTGGAIKGKGRADLYFGVGPYAEFSASFNSAKGNIYFLILKD